MASRITARKSERATTKTTTTTTARAAPSTATIARLALLGLAATAAAEQPPAVPITFTPNLTFDYAIPNNARFIRYRSGVNNEIPEFNTTIATTASLSSPRWRSVFAGNEIVPVSDSPDMSLFYGNTSVEHWCDAINYWSMLGFTFAGTRVKLLGYARGFVAGEQSSTNTGMPQLLMEADYSANNTAERIRLPQPAPVGNVLADSGDMKYGNHPIRQEFHPSDNGGLYVLQSLQITTGMETEATRFEDVPMYVDYAIVNGAQNPGWKVNVGTWQTESPFDFTTSLVFAGDEYKSYQHLNGKGKGSRIKVDIPYNTSYVIINGTGGPDQGDYNVAFNPPAIVTTAFPGQTTGTITTRWITPVILYMTPLDPKLKYTVTLTSSLSDLAVHSLTYYSGVLNGFPKFDDNFINDSGPDQTTTATGSGASTPAGPLASAAAKKNNIGAIVGGVVGGIVALVLIAAGVFFYRRRKQRVARADPTDFVIDDVLGPEPDPFPPGMVQLRKRPLVAIPPAANANPLRSKTVPHLRADDGRQGYTHDQMASTPSSDGSARHLLPPAVPPKWVVGSNQNPDSSGTLLSPGGADMLAGMAGFSAFGAGGATPGRPGRLTMASDLPRIQTTTPTRTPPGGGAVRGEGPRVNQRIHQESDGGSFMPDGDDASDSGLVDEVVVVPPSYDPNWRKSRRMRAQAGWGNEHALRLKTSGSMTTNSSPTTTTQGPFSPSQ